jgi:hypothetical protein
MLGHSGSDELFKAPTPPAARQDLPVRIRIHVGDASLIDRLAQRIEQR